MQLNLISGEDAIWQGGALPLSNMTAPYDTPRPTRMGGLDGFLGLL
jgi:hypothetical protein